MPEAWKRTGIIGAQVHIKFMGKLKLLNRVDLVEFAVMQLAYQMRAFR